MLGSARTHFGCGKEGQAGAQEKKEIPRGSLQTCPGGTFPSWGQGIAATPLEPATFPQVFGILLLGRSKRYTLVPSGTKESKHAGAGKKSLVGQLGQVVSVLAMAGEDNDPNRDPVPKGQVSRPGPSSLPTISPPTLPRTHVFTCASSVHPSGVAIGCPSISGSLGCQIGVLLLGTNVKVALRVCWVWFSTLGLFPASSTRLGLEWKGGLVAELGQGDPLKASQSFGV